MIAKLEWTLSNVQQNIEQLQAPTMLPNLLQNVVFLMQVHEYQSMSKVSARLVPRNLNMQDRQQRVESSQELLEVYNTNLEDFHTRRLTADKTWLHNWDQDAKKESMQWKCSGSSSSKTFRDQPSSGKVVAMVFCDSKGIISIYYKPVGTSVTG